MFTTFRELSLLQSSEDCFFSFWQFYYLCIVLTLVAAVGIEQGSSERHCHYTLEEYK